MTLYCSNCGQPLDARQRVCPNCGKEQPPAPVLEGQAPPPGQFEKLLTGVAWLDIVLGIVAVFGSLFLYGIGFLLAPILYFVLRPHYPSFARGLGYGLLTIAAIFLGLLAWCIAVLSSGGFG